MAFTEQWQADVNARLLAIETLLNDLQKTLNKFPTKVQVNALTNVRQKEIDDLKQRVTLLESQIATLLRA